MVSKVGFGTRPSGGLNKESNHAQDGGLPAWGEEGEVKGEGGARRVRMGSLFLPPNQGDKTPSLGLVTPSPAQWGGVMEAFGGFLLC